MRICQFQKSLFATPLLKGSFSELLSCITSGRAEGPEIGNARTGTQAFDTSQQLQQRRPSAAQTVPRVCLEVALMQPLVSDEMVAASVAGAF